MASVTWGHGFLHDCDTIYDGTTGTADSGTTTTTVDAERTEAEDYWNGYKIKYTSGDNAGLERKISDFVAATDTITHAAFPNAVSAGDTYELSLWHEDQSATLTSTDIEVLEGDYIKLTGTASAADKKTYWEYNLSDVSSNTYTKFLARYKTSTTATGLKAKIELVFTVGTQTILDSTFSEDALWVVMDPTTITQGKTIDKIRFYAVSDAACSGEYVLFDFALICQDTFTFPNIGHGFTFAPTPRDAIIPIFGRDGDITQAGGTESALATVSCDLDVGDNWKRPQNNDTKTDTRKGQVFYEIAGKRSSEAWQWLDTGFEQFKATLEAPQFRRERISDNKVSHILDLTFREYRLSNASNTYESYVERWGLNL